MIAKKYAQALLELGHEQNILDILYEELKAVTGILSQEKDLQRILYHPQISSEQKKEIWQKLLQGKSHQLTLNFLLLLAERKRDEFLLEIFQEFESAIREERKISLAEVTTAVELDDDQKGKLLEKLVKMTGKEKIELETKVDPRIIGGIIVKVGNVLIDDSIVKHLTSLRKKTKEIQLKGVNG